MELFFYETKKNRFTKQKKKIIQRNIEGTVYIPSPVAILIKSNGHSVFCIALLISSFFIVLNRLAIVTVDK